jgi:short-subunit dehydrogenase
MPTTGMSWEHWEWIMGINFWGTVYCTQFFLPMLLEQPAGHIANVSSVFGLGAVKDRAGYCASKFASRGFTESLRQELFGTTVNVSVVLPGGVRTNMVHHARGWKDPVEQKKAALLQKEGNMTGPEKAARIIIKGIKKNRPRILIGLDAKLLDITVRLFPSYYDRLLNFFISRAEKRQDKKV